MLNIFSVKHNKVNWDALCAFPAVLVKDRRDRINLSLSCSLSTPMDRYLTQPLLPVFTFIDRGIPIRRDKITEW